MTNRISNYNYILGGFAFGTVVALFIKSVITPFIYYNYPMSQWMFVIMMIALFFIVFYVCYRYGHKATIIFRAFFLGIAFKSSIDAVFSLSNLLYTKTWNPSVFYNMYLSIFLAGLFALYERLVVLTEKL